MSNNPYNNQFDKFAQSLERHLNLPQGDGDGDGHAQEMAGDAQASAASADAAQHPTVQPRQVQQWPLKAVTNAAGSRVKVVTQVSCVSLSVDII